MARRWLRWAALFIAGAALVFPLATAGSASAATPQATKLGNFKVTYKDSWTFKSRDIRICVTFTVTGNITYTVSQSTAGRYQLEDIWTSQSLNDPTLRAVIHGYNGGRCDTAAKATGMEPCPLASGRAATLAIRRNTTTTIRALTRPTRSTTAAIRPDSAGTFQRSTPA
jgi:hypothetical protein